MRLFVGITDKNWFEQLSVSQPDEVNFWKPGEKGAFGVLGPGELFLFKLHAPHNFIVGGGYFVKFSRLPLSIAWSAFGEKNGVTSHAQFLARVRKYRAGIVRPDPSIGNIVLTQPFWFGRDEWIPTPADWPKSTVQGKGYDALASTGLSLLRQVQDRLGASREMLAARETANRYGKGEVNFRLGQGGFRVLVTEAYERRCAITGESTLPVLESAHIQPYAESGPHALGNGLLLRSDMHTLFDRGLLTVTPDFHIEVSSQIREQYSNGKLYYSYHGESLRSLPTNVMHQPDTQYLDWHNQNVFLR